MSASCAQSQRDFSSVGHSITGTRSRRSPQKVEAVELIRWSMRAGLIVTGAVTQIEIDTV
jgi:hypothetical protein